MPQTRCSRVGLHVSRTVDSLICRFEVRFISAPVQIRSVSVTGDLPSSCQEVCQESREEGDALGSLNKAWTARNQEPAPTVAKGTPPGTGQRSCHHCQYQALVTYFKVDLGEKDEKDLTIQHC